MSGEYIKARFTVPSSVTISATNSGGGPTSVAVTAGDYYIDELCSELQTQLNATLLASNGDPWSVDLREDGRVDIECTDGNPWSISWTSTALRDVLGYAADLTSVTGAQTGTKQARGIWYPHCSILLDGDPATAPRVDDGRASVSPTQRVYKIVGVASGRRLRNIRYTHVPSASAWAARATLVNADYETFYIDTQSGLGHSWFSAASVCVVGWDNGGSVQALGDGTVTEWQFSSPQTLDELALAAAPWTGYVTITLGDARSTG